MRRKLRSFLRIWIRKLDVSKAIASHLIGSHHTIVHRRLAGIMVMATGVILVKCCIFFDSMAIHIIADIVGYGIHGIGLIPFVTSVETLAEDV